MNNPQEEFDWQEYLYLALELAGRKGTPQCNDEADKRTAISRAYYAAFRKARNFLIVRDNFEIDLGTGSSHNQVIYAFKNHPNHQRQILGENLRRMKIYRESADYDGNFNGSLDSAVDFVIERAEDVIKMLNVIA